jgi:hypothetical protein
MGVSGVAHFAALAVVGLMANRSLKLSVKVPCPKHFDTRMKCVPALSCNTEKGASDHTSDS